MNLPPAAPVRLYGAEQEPSQRRVGRMAANKYIHICRPNSNYFPAASKLNRLSMERKFVVMKFKNIYERVHLLWTGCM